MATSQPKYYKLNIDGAAKSLGLNSMGGGVIRSSEGDWILGFAKHIEFGNSIQTELIALLHGLRLALQHGYLPVGINIDAKEVINLFHSDNPHYTNLLTYCRLLLKQLGNPLLQHVYREHNMVVDGLENYGTHLISMQQWLASFWYTTTFCPPTLPCRQRRDSKTETCQLLRFL